MPRNFYYSHEKVKIRQVGAKASNLAWLQQNSYHIPESCFISIQAEHDFLAGNALLPLVDDLRKIIGIQPLQQLKDYAQQLIAAIGKGKFSDHFLDELNEVLKQFVQTQLAVRSSALAEDLAEHSFAGQYETVLHVEAESNAVQDAIKKVWASQWNERVLSYCENCQQPLPPPGMGVILQEMLSASISGVLFTRNPAQISGHEALIEYIEGVGEALVSGERTPFQLRYSITESKFIGRPEIKPELSGHFEQLIRQSLTIEKKTGRPADIEWALANNRIYFLQYRPITTGVNRFEQEILWTNENVGEVIPDVVTPYSWSVLEPISNNAFHQFLRMIGVKKYPAGGLFGLYHGKVYFNNTEFNRTMRRFYLSELVRQMKSVRGFVRVAVLLLASAWSLLRAGFLAMTLPSRIERYLRSYRRRFSQIIYRSDESVTEAHSTTHEIIKLHSATMSWHIACAIYGEIYFQLLNKLCERWLPADFMISAESLLMGENQAESAKSGLALWQLSRYISEQNDVKEIFFNNPLEEVEIRLKKNSLGKEALQMIDKFIEQFGHGALHEFELSYPRWWEDRSYIYSSIKSYLSSKAEFDMQQRLTEQTARRGAQIQKAINYFSGLKNILKKIIFTHVLHRTQRLTRLRENLKQAIVKAHSELKKHMLLQGRYMKTRQQIADPQDILFLSQFEIDDWIERGFSAIGLDQLIAQRKVEHENNSVFRHPSKLRQCGQNWFPEGEKHETDKQMLTGIGCSAGVVEGPVRVILQPECFEQMNAGEILVTHATNPGWTPLFVLASGVITEIGGALSHGAIIAREYGLPMVAAAPGATTRLKNGVRVRLDGQKGTVDVLESK